MPLDTEPQHGYWATKFRLAFRGVKIGVRGQGSFFVHFFAAAAAITAGVVLQVSREQWCLIVLCIAVVMAAEMFNSALEALARAVSDVQNPHVADALDISSAAVLIASIGASLVGLTVFLPRMAEMLGW